MSAYYNERDPFAATWLRELVKQNMIAPGEVDERDILDVRPSDLKAFTQCHFFAGIGVWSYALRLAGWPDDRRVWTGSCPCQPFSAAGKAGGFDDERHLWPALHYLIEECRPGVVFGEQVASKDGLAWLDLVQVDMEGTGYAIGALDTCAAGFGAPHIRQRLWFAADADGRYAGAERQQRGGQQRQFAEDGGALRLADDERPRLERFDAQALGHERAAAERSGASSRLGNTERERAGRDAGTGVEAQGRAAVRPERDDARPPGTTHWTAVEWIDCRDGKTRPTKPGIFPLAYGTSGRVDAYRALGQTEPENEKTKWTNRVGTLRGAGNAIVAPQAAEFIKAYLETRGYFRMTLLEVMTELAERGLLFSLYQTSTDWICNIRSGDNKRLLGRAKSDGPDEAARSAFEDMESGPLSAEEAYKLETEINADGDLFA